MLDILKNRPRTWGAEITIETAQMLIKSECYKETAISWASGYISRKTAGRAFIYSGKYGDGVIICRPSFSSSHLFNLCYYCVPHTGRV